MSDPTFAAENLGVTANELNFAAKKLSYCAKMLNDQSDQSTIPSVPETRSILLGRIQDALGDGKVSSDLRSFCELCQEANLEPLESMSENELITLSDNCVMAIKQCEYFNV